MGVDGVPVTLGEGELTVPAEGMAPGNGMD